MCHRWQKVLRAGLVKGAFTEEEDKIIIACMNEGGLTWMQIAERNLVELANSAASAGRIISIRT